MGDVDRGVPRLAIKLNWLMANIRNADGSKATSESIAAYLTERGISASTSSIGHLRTGYRSNPSWQILDGIADYFGIPGQYWSDDAVEQAVRMDVARLDNTYRPERAELVARIAALSPEQLRSFTRAVDALDNDH
ncbi:hypothetical protein [Luteipulveratus mongoliensis]|uniref:hypothetical protein n=1 Tax=Luteipulveratus mongoliensis TaxID=571913 RepID=UPI000698E755|nr:hypothetical protein [Luteipulveratus mongoliensis]